MWEQSRTSEPHADLPIGTLDGRRHLGQSARVATRTIFIYEGELAGSYILFPHDTGVVYHYQFGGLACRQWEMQGYLVPVNADTARRVLDGVFVDELQRSGIVVRESNGQTGRWIE